MSANKPPLRITDAKSAPVVHCARKVSEGIFPMPTRWMQAYEAAIREQDRAKIPDLCEQARRAILERTLEQGERAASESEQEELREALRQLTIHELRLPRPN